MNLDTAPSIFATRAHSKMSELKMNLESIKSTAPSIFATRAHSKMSDRYAFVSSADIVNTLVKDHDFSVVSAHQRRTRVRNPEFTRHQVVLRPNGLKPILNEVLPQVLLTNSHDGQSRFVMRGGIFRLVCLNGLVTSIADTVASSRHLGDAKVIVDAALEIVAKVSKVTPIVSSMMKKKINERQAAAFATKAAKIAYDEPLSFDPKLLLAVRRPEDKEMTVWQVFNRVQENIIRGGITFKSKASQRDFTTRGITHIGRSMTINSELWEAAEALV